MSRNLDSLQYNLVQLLNQETTSFLKQRLNIHSNQLISSVETSVSFLLRLVERADSFNYYELASLFTRNGRDTNTPEKIINSIKAGHKHEALSDARKLLNMLLRDQQETFQKLLAKQQGLTKNQSEEVLFIAAILTNVLLGYCMITNKMNMRAITRHIKSEAIELSEKMTIEMKQLNRELTLNNLMIDENKPLRVEQKSNSVLYAGFFAGFLIISSILYKACSGTVH